MRCLHSTAAFRRQAKGQFLPGMRSVALVRVIKPTDISPHFAESGKRACKGRLRRARVKLARLASFLPNEGNIFRAGRNCIVRNKSGGQIGRRHGVNRPPVFGEFGQDSKFAAGDF
jgi:hypothetical protein